MKRKKRF